MENSLLLKKIEDKTIAWFQQSNQYIVVEDLAAEVLQQLNSNVASGKITDSLSKKLNIPTEVASSFIKDTNKLLTSVSKTPKTTTKEHFQAPKTFQTTKKYRINSVLFYVHFESELDLSFVHPKFAHTVIETSEKPDYTYVVFQKEGHIVLHVNGTQIGSWPLNEIHYFQGKFSMQIVQHIHQKIESEWLGVFHASAVSNGKKSILFLGDSGNGKSTSLALLQAHGFTCLADDFVPVAKDNNKVYSFPSAISIKKNSVPVLSPLYPELNNAAEYHFKRLNKIVRYLPPNNKNNGLHLSCNDFVFIKYLKNSEIQVEKISNLDAFERVVPDAWLSPLAENAQQFLDWFQTIRCYQITYGNNEKMLDAVSKLFKNNR